MPSSRKGPLADITHRPLTTGRRANNASSPLATSLACAAQGDENSPARGLLEIFAAAQTGSLVRKRSLKLTSDDCDSLASPTLASAVTSSAATRSTISPSDTATCIIGEVSINASATTTATTTTSTTTTTAPLTATIPANSTFRYSYNSTRPSSLLWTLSRQQTYGRVRNRPMYLSTRSTMLDYISRPDDVYTFISQDAATLVPPFSCAYNNVANDARNLAVGDEDGTIHIVDTRRGEEHPGNTIQIQAHLNAIFDLCWTSDDSKIISVSGDQTAKLYDIETKTCLGVFYGHSGSIKSVSMKVGDDNIFATAARDGAVMIWDARCSSTASANGDSHYKPANRLMNVHANSVRASPSKKSKNGSDGPNTASAVQYMMHNENMIATTGAADGSVKYWDVRKHGSYFKHDYPAPLQTSTYTPLTKRAHGMTSMALSPDGSSLYAVSSDNHIYRFNTMSLGHPVERFGGGNFTCSSYYIKISVSPDGNYVAAGSCKDLYVWEVNRPDRKPLVFQGHEREVTGVDWARDIGNGTELSGCSDDATVRTWKPNRELVEECRENHTLRNMHGMVIE
ncbi:hypothetical protein BGZ98_008606 [Dissophora globulifera]|nr:hypothetical protein BGZ98_008606 [Dissophora globulifera]